MTSFKELKKISEENKVGINYAVNWLIKKSIEATTEIINSIFLSMEENRKVPKGKEIFIFKKKDT